MSRPLALGLAVLVVAVVVAVLARDSDEAEVRFDALNATFEVECIDDVGPVPFVDGEWASDVFDDIGRSSHYARIYDTQVAELVNDSPGPEVAVEIVCNWGGSHSTMEVQVFAGNSSKATRLGQILQGQLERAGGPWSVVQTNQRRWMPSDPHCCPTKFVLTNHEWRTDRWVETSSEVWAKESENSGS